MVRAALVVESDELLALNRPRNLNQRPVIVFRRPSLPVLKQGNWKWLTGVADFRSTATPSFRCEKITGSRDVGIEYIHASDRSGNLATYRVQAEECRRLAAKTANPIEKDAWHRLAEDLLKLAQDVDRHTTTMSIKRAGF